jgi:RHS repeat-associated protein
MNTTAYSLSYTFGHGDVVSLIDNDGNIIDSYSYDPFGKTTGVSKNSNGARYVGGVSVFSDDDTGLQYMWNRWYDPELGRFISRDPLGFGGGDTNLYAYVGNNPLNGVDPYGLATYSQNRQLMLFSGGRGVSMGWWQPISHTFVYTTDSNGNLAHTYSWGNNADLRGWSLDQREDKEAAAWSVSEGNNWLNKEGDDDLDPFIAQSLDMLMTKCDRHANLVVTNNCKVEAKQVIALAKKLSAQAQKAKSSLGTKNGGPGCGNK